MSLNSNNQQLQTILERVNALPDAGGSAAPETCTVTINRPKAKYRLYLQKWSRLIDGEVKTFYIRMLIDGLKEASKYMLTTGMDYEYQMSQVQAISGATTDELEQLNEKAKEMGAITKFSASESAEAFTFMAQAGWQTEQMLDGIEGVMNLAAAGGADLATSAEIVTTGLTAMGYAAGDAGRLADVMAVAAAASSTDVEKMGYTFKYAAPIAGTFGYTMEDLAVAMGVMANNSITAETAGTQLRAGMLRMTKPTDEMATAMEKYGLSITNSDGSMKSLMEVMTMYREKLGGLTAAEQAKTAATLFGTEAASGWLAIINSSPEDFDKMTQAITFTLPSNAAASYSVAVTVTDSRGFTATSSTTLTTLAYSAPTITSVTATRGNGATSSAFIENSKGNNLRIVFAGSITSLSNVNAKTYQIEYRLSNSTTYTTLVSTTTLSSYAFSVSQYTSAMFSENSSYVLRISVSDSFETVSQIIDVPSQKVLMNFSANGKAMAIGGIASVDDALEIMMESYMTGGIKPMQLANGTDFDEIVKAGLYIGNAASGEYVNTPMSTGTFILDVSSAGSAGQLMQRYSYCSKNTYRAYVRFYYSSTWGDWQPTEGFTAFETSGYSGRVRFANGLMIQWGRVSVAPDTANVTKSVDITYPIEFVHAPIVQAHAHTSAPQLVDVSISVGGVSGATIYLTRTNTTATWVSWVAIGKG